MDPEEYDPSCKDTKIAPVYIRAADFWKLPYGFCSMLFGASSGVVAEVGFYQEPDSQPESGYKDAYKRDPQFIETAIYQCWTSSGSRFFGPS